MGSEDVYKRQHLTDVLIAMVMASSIAKITALLMQVLLQTEDVLIAMVMAYLTETIDALMLQAH